MLQLNMFLYKQFMPSHLIKDQIGNIYFGLNYRANLLVLAARNLPQLTA